MLTSKRLISNTIFNIVNLVAASLVSFFLIGFFLAHLGEENYGLWILIGSIFNYRVVLSLGLNSSVNRYIPVYLAQNNYDGVRRTINTSLFYYLLVSLILVLATLLFCHKINSWFFIKQNLSSVASVLVLIVGLSFAFAMPLQLFGAVLSGLQRYDLINIPEIIILTVRTILVISFVLNGFGLVAIGIIFGGSEIIVRIVQFAISRAVLPQFSFSFSNIDFKLLKEMIFYGINTLLYSMGDII
ncbi:MAG: lipopolysaccharide biosynthesis protein, partial [Promethearchaeota archaeon]